MCGKKEFGMYQEIEVKMKKCKVCEEELQSTKEYFHVHSVYFM